MGKIDKKTNGDFSPTVGYFTQKRINIKGFSSQQQDAFITKHTKSCSEDDRQLIKLKLQRMVDKEFLKCPLFLFMLIVTITEHCEIENSSRTKTELYKQVFTCITRRYFTKIKYSAISETDLFSYTGNTTLPHIELLKEFSNFCVWAIRGNNISFTYNEIVKDENHNPQILDLGFLMQSITTNLNQKTLVYEPVHKSLMEFGAAYGFWLALVDGSYYNKRWDKHIVSLTLGKDSSLFFPFLIGLMGNRAGLMFSALLPYKVKYFLKFRSWYSALSEMEVTESNVKSLGPFLPSVFSISAMIYGCYPFFKSDQYKSVVRQALEDGSIKQIEWDISHEVALPTGITVDTLVLSDYGDVNHTLCSNSNICDLQTNCQCKTLWFGFIKKSQLVVFKHVLQGIDFEHLFLCLDSDMLSEIVLFLKNEKIKIYQLSWMKINFSRGKFQTLQIGELIPVIRSKLVNRLAITVSFDRPSSCVPVDAWHWQKRLCKLLTALGSSELTAFTLESVGDPFTVDIDVLCNGGKKHWEWIQLKGVKVKCRSTVPSKCSIACLNLTEVDCSESTTHFIQRCKLKSLTCQVSLLEGNIDSWPVCSALTELYIAVNEEYVQKGISSILTVFKNLQVLGLAIHVKSLTCPVEEWLLGSKHSLCLNGIELWNAYNYPKLDTQLVKGITSCLSTESSHQVDLQSKIIQLNYLLIDMSITVGDKIKVLQDVARITKQPLVQQHFPRLEIAYFIQDDLVPSTILEEFPIEEGFRISSDIWGERENDTIKSKMENDRKPRNRARISISYSQLGRM